MERTSFYTQDNTAGYTDEELAGFNAEMDALLTPLYAEGGCPDLDTVNDLILRHNKDVADR